MNVLWRARTEIIYICSLGANRRGGYKVILAFSSRIHWNLLTVAKPAIVTIRNLPEADTSSQHPLTAYFTLDVPAVCAGASPRRPLLRGRLVAPSSLILENIQIEVNGIIIGFLGC